MTAASQVMQANKLDDRLPDHLAANERTALKALVERLYQRYGDALLRIVLFGSKARGDFDEESDLDLLIVVRMSNGRYRQHWHEIVDLVWEVEFEYGIVTSLIIKDEPTYATMLRHGLLLHREIEQDGIILWTKQPDELISISA